MNINKHLAFLLDATNEKDFVAQTKKVYLGLSQITNEIQYQILIAVLSDIDYTEYKDEKQKLNPNLEMK